MKTEENFDIGFDMSGIQSVDQTQIQDTSMMMHSGLGILIEDFEFFIILNLVSFRRSRRKRQSASC